MRFVVMMDVSGRWYWELRAIDDEVVAQGPMGFADRESAIRRVNEVRFQAPKSPIYGLLGNLYDGS